jgi:hypothetical protein
MKQSSSIFYTSQKSNQISNPQHLSEWSSPRQRNRTHPNSISNKREKNHAKTVKDETKSPLTNIARI